MDESSVYNESDLAPFRRRLNDLRSIIKSDSESGKHPEAMTKLLDPELRARMGASSREIINRSCRMDLEVQGYLDAIARGAEYLSLREGA